MNKQERPDPNYESGSNQDHSRFSNHQPRYGWVVMGNLFALELPTQMVFFSIGILIPLWVRDLGMTPIQAGIMGSTGFLGFGLMALPASIWLTKYNPRMVTLICSLLMALSIVAHFFSPNVEMLILSRFAFVLFAVSRIQMHIIFIQQWFQPRLYALVNSLDFSARSIGQIAAVALTPFLIIMFGNWRYIYLAMTVATLVFSLSWAILGKERLVPQTLGGPPPQSGNPAGVLKRHKIIWVIMGYQIGAATAFASFITFYPTYAMQHLGVNINTAGFLMGVLPIGGVIGSMSAGWISQKIGLRRPLIWIPGIFLPMCYIFLLLTSSITLSIVFLLGIGIFAMAVPPILSTIPMDMKLPPREVTVSIGLMRTIFPAAATIGPMIVGMAQETSGSLFLGLLVVAPLPITLAIAGRIMPETGPRAETNRVSI